MEDEIYKFSKSTDTYDLKYYAQINNLREFNNFVYSSESDHESDSDFEILKTDKFLKLKLKQSLKCNSNLNETINDLRCNNRFLKILNLGLMSGIIILGLCMYDKKKIITNDHK